MKKQSIENIESQLEALKNELITFKNLQKQGGNMDRIVYQESSVNDYIESITVIIHQLSFLVKAHHVFSQISTLGERQAIRAHLNELRSFLAQGNFTYIEQQTGSLKTILRNYNIFFRKEFVSDFYAALNQLENEKGRIDALLVLLTEDLKKANDRKDSVDKLFESLSEMKKEIEDKITGLETGYSELSAKVDNATENASEIAELVASAKSHEEIIENFSARVEKRENQLTQQQVRTDEYNKKLVEYDMQQKEILKESTKLIESAKKALNYKTAEGISAAIQEQYNIAKSKWTTIPWLVSASVFTIVTLSLGVWLLIGSGAENWYLIVGRVVLLPITIIGAVFSASQYTKQKNIIEDYAYKMVLTKSIVGFSEELLKVKENTNEGYQAFVQRILNELWQDPLRERDKSGEQIEKKAKKILEDIAELAGKFLPKEK